jgi:hypothetical protein
MRLPKHSDVFLACVMGTTESESPGAQPLRVQDFLPAASNPAVLVQKGQFPGSGASIRPG